MSKVKIFFIGLAVGLILAGAGAVGIYFGFGFNVEKIKIVKEYIPGPTQYLPVDNPLACGPDIDITASIIAPGNIFAVIAQDACKRSFKNFELASIPKIKHHNFIVGYAPLYDIDSRAFRHTLDASYFYSFGCVFLGGGLAVQFDKMRVYQAGPRIVAGGSF